MPKISIALASDNVYAQHLGCAIASILLSSQNEEKFSFFILDNGISDQNKAKIRQLKQLKDCELIFFSIDMERFSECPELGHFTRNTFSRLLLPELLPEVERVLYLDSDMIVTGPLTELWETDLNGKALGAVKDSLTESLEDARKNFPGFDFTNDYFNAGMLLLDLKQIREEGWFQKVLDWIPRQEKLLFPDQDALNTFFHEKYTQLPKHWNLQVSPENEKTVPSDFQGILHFITGFKPWHYQYPHPAKSFYFSVLSRTPWKNYRPPKPPIRERVRKFLRESPTNQKFRNFQKKLKQLLKKKK